MGGAGPIPWTAIERYAARHGVDDLDEFERFGRLIRIADGEFLKHIAENMKVKKPG